MKYNILFFLLSVFLSSADVQAQEPSDDLKSIIEKVEEYESYDRKEFPLGLYTEDRYEKEAEFARRRLQELEDLEESRLSESELVTLKLLQFRLQEEVDHYEYEAYLNPLLSDAGFHVSLPYHVGELNNYSEVKTYLNKLNAIPEYVDQHLVLLREGLRKGITQPRVIFNGYGATYNDQIVDDPKDSYYYSPFLELPEDLSAAQKDSVLAAAERTVAKNVIPQFKRIKAFFETEYLPNTRSSIGVSEIPNGRDYYQNRLDYYTTLNLSADEIHEIGLKQVARINTEMKKIIEEVGFESSFDEFIEFLRTDEQFYASSGEELLTRARDISKRLDAQLPRFFKKLPRKPYGVAPVPDAIAPKYTTGRYVGASSETDPGYYWVNTYNLESRPLYVLPALTAHEAVPGHHLQIELNKEGSDSIPQFRKNMYLSAFGEGWGLYAEFLAEDMGIYTTPYEMFGKLTYEQWRACRLVVDTGMHAKGWTRAQAVDFLSSNTALSHHEINTEIDRYISWPGQAVSYKIGELKIRELREKAKEQLGSRFDIRNFHHVILSQGTVTLEIMEQLVDQYIQEELEEKATTAVQE